MAVTQKQSEPAAGPRRRSRPYVLLAGVILLILLAGSAVAYYGEEIRLYLSLGGWNRAAAVRVVEEFVGHMQEGRIQEAVALVDPEHYRPYSEGGREVGLEHQDLSGRGRYFLPFDTLIPPGKVELGRVQLTAADGGGFVVPARFADGTEGWFVVARSGSKHRIVGLPTVPGRFHY